MGYFTLGLVASATFHGTSAWVARQQAPENLSCEILYFFDNDNQSGVRFRAPWGEERFAVPAAVLRPFEQTEGQGYRLHLRLRPGIWGCYLVDDYRIAPAADTYQP